jgi:hypothetical protein
MSDNFSLRTHIQQRKAQELQRAIESRQIERITGQAPRPTSSTLARPVAARNVQPVPQKQPAAAVRIAPSGKHRQRMIMIGAGAAIFLICMATVLLASNQPGTPPQVAYKAIPSVQPEQVILQLKQAGVSVTRVTTGSMGNGDQNWHAQEVVQFEVHDGASHGKFTMLSYDSPSTKALDFGAFALDPRYQNQTITEQANILLIASSDTDKTINTEVKSQMVSLLTAPYRDYYSIAKP